MSGIELVTERLKLRFIELSDLDAIHCLHSLPETDKYNALGIPKDIAETKSIIEPWIAAHEKTTIKNYTFAMDKRSNEAFIGLFGLKLGKEKYKMGEVWYKIHSDYWNQGFATECLKAVINFGFDSLGLHRIEAGCAVENIASIKVLEKAGMLREGKGRKILPLRSGWSDNYNYSILDTDER